jgi:hypothetical protein
VRLLVFCAIYSHQSHDAQWQLSYMPVWVMDFPISIAYFLFRIPIPWGEAAIGPVWWFFVPIIIWRLSRIRKSGQKK